MDHNQVIKELNSHADKNKATDYQRFFQTKKGQYGENDTYLGVNVPTQRKIAKKYQNLSLKEIEKLLHSKIHEHRLTALIIMTLKYKGNEKDIVDLYLKNVNHINNWDLVDVSAHKIIGTYAKDYKQENIIIALSNKDHLWSNRIALVATYSYIKAGSFSLIKKLSTKFLNHPHHLIHKASGWMLREMGKQSKKDLVEYLNQHYQKMPRTTLRYAIEKFPEKERQKYLKGLI